MDPVKHIPANVSDEELAELSEAATLAHSNGSADTFMDEVFAEAERLSKLRRPDQKELTE